MTRMLRPQKSCPSLSRVVILALGLMGTWLVAPSHGQVDGWPASEGAIAWWAFDPSVGGAGAGAGGDQPPAGRLLVEAGLRVALASGLVEEDDAAELVSGVLAASVIGRHPHRITLLDVGVRENEDGSMALDELGVVLEIRTDQAHAPFMQTIQAILVDGPAVRDPQGDRGEQRVVELPGERQGVAFRRDGWPAWRELSWCSTEGSFLVGVGRGALVRWFDQLTDAPEAGLDGAAAHREEVGSEGDRFAEFWVDVNRLRRAAPEAFGQSKLSRIVEGSGFANGRDLMIHARWLEPDTLPEGAPPALVAIDTTWSARSEPPGRINRERVSESTWPGDVIARPPGTYAIIARANWDRWIDLAARMYTATRKPDDARSFAGTYARWRHQQRSRLGFLTQRSSPWVVLSDAPRPRLAAPGVATLFVDVLPHRAARARFRSEFGRLMHSLGESVAFDDATRRWSVGLAPPEDDPNGLLRMFTWSLIEEGERAVVVGGWGAAAVESNRARIAGDP